MVIKSYLRFSLDIYGRIRDKKHKGWFSKVFYGSLWLLTERTGIKIIWVGSPKLFTVLFGYQRREPGIKIIWVGSPKKFTVLFGYQQREPGIKIIWVGSPKLFTVLFGYSTDGSGIKIIWVGSQKIIIGSLWLFKEGFGIKITVFGYQELTYWFAAVLAENWCLVSSLISSFTDSWCFFCKILDFFWIFLPRKGDFNKREERAMIFSKEPLT